MAATPEGLTFWDGTSWRPVALQENPGRTVTRSEPPLMTQVAPSTARFRFVRRMPSGGWLLGGERSLIQVLRGHSIATLLTGKDPERRFVFGNGEVDDLAVFVSESDTDPPLLQAVAARHWVKPASMTRASSITSLARLDDERWIVTGRATSAEGFAVLYTPLEWEVKRLKTPAASAYLTSATRPELGLGIVAGTEGRVLCFHRDTTQTATIPGEPAISAVALDPEGRAWAASLGRLWTLDPGADDAWRAVWEDAGWQVPFVSVSADGGRVMAMTVDGGILEGRWETGAQ
jgi:hypothetical protein